MTCVVRFRTLPLAALIWALLLAPATAQDARAKEGWDMLRASLTEAGFLVTSEGVANTDRGLEVRGLTIRSTEGADAVVLSMPTLGIEPRGADAYAFIPGRDSQLELATGGEVVFQFDGEVVFAQGDDSLRLAPAFDMLEATLRAPAGDDGEDRMTLSLGFVALSGEMTLGRGEVIDLTGELHIDTMRVDQNRMRGPSDDMEVYQRENAEIDNLVARIAIERLNVITDGPSTLEDVFAGGFALRMDYTSEASRSFSQQFIDGQQIRFEGSSGLASSDLTFANGALTAHGSAADFLLEGGLEGIEGSFAVEQVVGGFEMPLLQSTEPRPFSLMLEIEGMSASEESWALLGAQAFAADSVDVAIEVAGEGRWLVDPSEADNVDVPIDFSVVRLERLALRFGQAMFDGSGRFEPDPDAPSVAEGMPMGQGAFIFNLQGGEALLARLASEGIVPPDQQFLAQMMMGALGRRVGEDLLQSEVAILPGGQVTVNGLPLPF
ncbi:MAG: hypothetical protein JJU15_08045 [Pararhodobacter sp.]|nr:hypothetical protein [Pararhodobacter sp.]